MKKEEIVEFLREVEHPANGDKSIVELGMVENVEIEGSKVVVTLGFPKHRDPLAEYLIGSTRATIIRHCPGAEVEVKTIIKEAPKAKKPGLDLGTEEVEHVGRIIGVASGKGGVGKSTVAVNLAVALAQMGYRVGLADADVYGPSVPTMTGTVGMMPDAVNDPQTGKDVILPIEKYGVKWMSIGYFSKPEQALIWRGPMACNALKQMILQVRWGELDFLLIDMPPGTGDIHISLVHDIPFDGAVIVTTPQAVALADVEKGVNMFRNESINKNIYGLVENMAWFTPAELPENKYFIFGRDGGLRMAEKYGIPLLGQIPIVQSIREGGDEGEPAVIAGASGEDVRPDAAAFMELAANLVSEIQ